jgi:tRNA (guanine-N7-)-methyltransferase
MARLNCFSYVPLLSKRPASHVIAGSWRRHIMVRMSSHYWYKLEQLPWPADWPGLFGRSGPLVLEIGFGSGLFLVDLARRYPQANVLGLEISIPSVRNAGRKVQRLGLNNVRIMQADARSVLHVLCEPDSVASVYINFPDPWPKKDHVGRRLIDDSFLRLLATRMKTGGSLDIATDHEEYSAQISECLSRSPHFISRAEVVFSLVDENRVQTKYEQVALAEGRTPRYYKWLRTEAMAEERFPIPLELTMPHVVLRLPVNITEIGRRFRPHVVESDATRIRFVEMFQSLHDGKLLLETYISEGPVMQRLGLEMRARSNGDITISLAEVGFPRPTDGVHLAIASLVNWLRAEFPALVVVQTNLQNDHADTPFKRN